ncbi:hypothetical protein TCA2_4565 [Paenibacillus sp. TCA20]|uniref:PA14 domain-containing protein n=1 Tax=Paenibacillus sp. TCA20 TaxID=1499968 RepID=UPI0004DA6EB7|nr:PA14 domain-containing protein [Paenibacillus sp. TCA20]GAK42073.1 hypothetical protein TCA2_4565 [Paenibacillus sp. TCA20]
MAIINFDYKIKAEIIPTWEHPFHFAVYADVEKPNGDRYNDKLYEGRGVLNQQHTNYDSKAHIELDGVVIELEEGDVIQGYTAISLDPNVSIVVNESSIDSVYAWIESRAAVPIATETKWITAEQIDTNIHGTKETAKTLNRTELKQLLERNSEIEFPLRYDIRSLELISNKENVIMELSEEGIEVFGFDASLIENVIGSISVNEIIVTHRETIPVPLFLDVESASGIQLNLIEGIIDNRNIARVASIKEDKIWIEGMGVGETSIRINYAGVLIAETPIRVEKPKAIIHTSLDSKNFYVGQPFQIHLMPEYTNGDVFETSTCEYELQGGEVESQLDTTTLSIIPHTAGVLIMQVRLVSKTGEVVEATIKLPVRDKHLYRFHVQPEEATIVQGDKLSLSAQYQNTSAGMEHDDSLIEWSVLEGTEFVQMENSKGRSVILGGYGSGVVRLKASVYDNEAEATIHIVGQTQPILHFAETNILMAPGERKSIYPAIVNDDGRSRPIAWDIQQNSCLNIVDEGASKLVFEAITNGRATIICKAGDLKQQIYVDVSENRIQAFSTEAVDGSIYIPTEDSPEQWTDVEKDPNYIESPGMLTSMYTRTSGEEDPNYAFHSGIGDQDDLLVKKPQLENSVQPFQYAARLRGKKRHSIMIYPEIAFQYSVQYKGDLYVTYNESPFKVSIDAYPAKKFEFTIKEDRKLETIKDYEVEMSVEGQVTKKDLEYAVNWKANVEVNDEGDVKGLFVSGGDKGDFIGSGTALSWRLGSGYVYDTYNLSRFSGVVAKKYYDYTSYEAEFDYKPIAGDSSGIADDDLIGLIFKARDKRNFYMLLIESHERARNSNRTGDNLEGFNIYTGTPEQWNARSVRGASYQTESEWRLYTQSMGWKTQHRRVYKVTDGVMSRVNVNDLGGGNGWDFNVMQSMMVRSMGKKVELHVRHSLSGNYAKIFEFNTDWEEGSFGMCNISQAVQFHGIRVREWNQIEGRIPETGYDKYTGIGSKTISSSGREYVKTQVVSKLSSPSQKYEVTEVAGELTDSSAGSITASVTGAIVVKSNNPPNAGEPITQKFTKSGQIRITPDNIDLNTAAEVYTNAQEFFKAELSKFKSDHPEMSASSVVPTFTLVKPAVDDAEKDFTQERLLMWETEPEIVTTEIDYEHNVFAYEGWVAGRPLTDFVGGNWATYTLTFHDNSGTVNEQYDAWKWQNSGAVDIHHDPSDVLMLKTTEWYKGIFPADILNEGIVNSEEDSFVDIPPSHEHYIEPYLSTPMPGIYDNVHYLLYKEPIGKQTFTWMYWESQPGITTRNSGLPINQLTGKPIIKTDRQNDRVVVKCDEDPRYIPYTTGKEIGYGKVNGKRPFFGDSAGRANMIGVPTNTVFIPENMVNITGPYIEVSDDRVSYSIDAGGKTVTFSSDFKDAYVWHTDWYTGWHEDERGFHADLNTTTTIGDPISINPEDQEDYDDNVSIEGVEVISNNPFVSVWPTQAEGSSSGLLGTYYRYPQEIENLLEKFVVGGNFQIKEQVFVIEEAVAPVNTPGLPASETFIPGSAPVRGTIQGVTEFEVATVYVPAGKPILKIASNFMIDTGNKYPDLLVTAPNGEQFGVKYMNGTWSASGTTASDFLSCRQYTHSGDSGHAEVMTFTLPIEGTWTISVFNQGNAQTAYMVTTNIGTDVRKVLSLSYVPDPDSVSVKVNGISITAFAMDRKDVIITAPIVNEDVIEVNYSAGGIKIKELPMQTDFPMYDVPPYKVLSVRKNDVEIPESTTNGYSIDGQTFKIRGSYVTPGVIRIRYGVGEIDNTFDLANDPQLSPEVYLNGTKLDETKYSISGRVLTVDKELLMPKDWIHLQSYRVAKRFDPQKENYLGDVKMSRVDPFINFNWGTQSPFTESLEPAGFRMMAVIPDQIKFNLNVEMEISYPSSEVIDTSNFTGVWSKFDENIGSNVGDWHGPPEAGYDKVTNLANQSYRSGWYNPEHADMTDYDFEFMVQEIGSGDDDMYGAIFRFNPSTKNFYSFEWDANGMDTKGMAVYRNICTNPSQYGTALLSYNKVKLAHLPEPWAYGTDQTNKIRVRVVGQSIQVYTNDVLKFDIVDNSPDALISGAWGPVTMSQPRTYFWNFSTSKILKETIRKPMSAEKMKSLTDSIRTEEMLVSDQRMIDFFSSELSSFLSAHGFNRSDVSLQYFIKNDTSDYKTHFTTSGIVTSSDDAKVSATVITRPASTPEQPAWLDYREVNRGHLPPDTSVDVYSPDQPEPYIDPIQPADEGTPNDGFAINWKGSIYAPVSGTYTFYSTSDDGFRLWIDKKLIIDKWVLQSATTHVGSIELQGGKWYDFNANYFENEGTASVKLEWSHPATERAMISPDFFTPRLGYAVNARVKEATPLPWSPMIHNGYYYFKDKEHYLYAKKTRHVMTPVDHQLLIQPRPQQGAPMIVRDNEGNILRKTAFYEEVFNENGLLIDIQQTLTYKEELMGNGYSKYYLTYKGIDPDSLIIKLNGITISADKYVFDAEKSSIQFMNNVGNRDIMNFEYSLMYSYFVDYNHDPNNDVAKIVLHPNYDPDKMKDMEIIYEGDAFSPFYRAKEIALNPLLTHNHKGFLYLTNKILDTPKSVDINVSPKTLSSDGLGKVLVTGKVLDKYNNPIQNKNVDVYRDGELIYSGPTNRAGEVYVYDKPVPRAEMISVYQIICEDLNNQTLLNFYVPNMKDRYFLEVKTSKAAIQAGQDDKATIYITLRNENWENVAGERIKIVCRNTKGEITTSEMTTNVYGQAEWTVSALNEQQGNITVTASYSMEGETASNFIYLKVIGA